jgi:ribosomal protein S18 acetylase RimI-like enzyme
MPQTLSPQDAEAALDLIVRLQQDPATATAYLGKERGDIASDLSELDQPWTETGRIVMSPDGRLLGVAVIEWDKEADRSWVHGPWLEADVSDADADALLAAVTSQAPVGTHEMYAGIENTSMARLAERAGWRTGEANFEYGRVREPGSVGPDPAVRAGSCDDLDAVRSLHDGEFPGTYATASELLDPAGNYRTLVYTPGATVLGYIAWQERSKDTIYVDFVAAYADLRRRGVGSRLLDAAQAASGRSRVELTVDEHRTGALAFYETLGFTVQAATRPYRAQAPTA